VCLLQYRQAVSDSDELLVVRRTPGSAKFVEHHRQIELRRCLRMPLGFHQARRELV